MKINDFMHNKIISIQMATKRKSAQVTFIIKDGMAKDIMAMLQWSMKMTIDKPPITCLMLSYNKEESPTEVKMKEVL